MVMVTVTVTVREAVMVVNGVVKAVDREARLVILSFGREEGVREGEQFTVSREDQFIGKVEVIRLYADLAGAQILFEEPGEAVRPEDRASRLPGGESEAGVRAPLDPGTALSQRRRGAAGEEVVGQVQNIREIDRRVAVDVRQLQISSAREVTVAR